MAAVEPHQCQEFTMADLITFGSSTDLSQANVQL